MIVTLAPDGAGVTVRRIDPANGNSLWSVPVTGLAAGPTVRISADRSLVAVASESETAPTVVMAAADGRVVWQGVTGEYVPKVEAVDDLLLVGLRTGTVAVDRATGTTRWQVPYSVEAFGTTLIGTEHQDSTNHHSLLDPATGAPVWTTTSEGPSVTHVVEDTFLITTDVEGTFHDRDAAYDLATGKRRWRGASNNLGTASVTPVYENTALIVGGINSMAETATSLTVLDLTDGVVKWESQSPARVYTTTIPIRMDGEPYVLTETNETIEVRDARTGDVTSSAPNTFGRMGQLAGGALYRAGFDGVRAFQLPDLTGQWQTTMPIENGVIDAPIPGGFVIAEFTDLEGYLVGYLG